MMKKVQQVHQPTIFTFLKLYIKDQFPQFVVGVKGSTLYVDGQLSDDDWGKSYRFLIAMTLNSAPKAFIIEPKITSSPGIHMYSDSSLCLYYPKDLPYKYNFTLLDDIIPWLIKWIYFYEIWLRNGGIWIGPEAPHGT